MTRLDKLTALAQRTGLLRAEDNAEQRVQNAVDFTHFAAWELRDEGFAAVKSTDEKAAHGIVPGVILNRDTRERARIIANVDSDNPVVVYEELPRAGKEVEHVAPVDPSQNPALQAAVSGARTTATTEKHKGGDKDKGADKGKDHGKDK